ncbi:MAG TPA: glycosyltransferase 87 family protein, partial [Ktedonobacterales bacterium]
GAAGLAVAYPPGTPYLFGGVVLLYNLILAPITHTPLTELVNQSGVGPFFAKLVLLAADLATTVLLYHEARKRHSQRFAWLAAASFALSPAVLYDGAVWGQTDTLLMFPVLIAIFALLSKRYSLAGGGLAVAMLIKPQAAIFIPLVMLYLWRWARREDFIRFTAILAGILLLFLLPLMIPHFELFNMVYNMRAVAQNDNFPITLDAFNFWWLTGLHAHSMGSTLLGIRIGLVADALFVAVTLINGVLIWRHQEAAYLCFGLAMEAFGFFMFMGGQLERYLFPFIPLMLATLIASQRKSSLRLLNLYVTGTALCMLNMMVSIAAALVGVSPILPYVGLPLIGNLMASLFGILDIPVAASLAVTYGYAMWIYLGGRFEPLAEEVSSRSQPSSRVDHHALPQILQNSH